MALDKEDLQEMRDRIDRMRAGTSAMLTELTALTIDMDEKLNNWGDEDPPLPPPVAQPSALRFARHLYNNKYPVDLGAFSLYDLQRGFTTNGVLKPGDGIAVYTTVVRRDDPAKGDPLGMTQFLKPNLVPDSWCVHTQDGSLVTRTRDSGVEALINFAHPQWLSMAIPNIVAQAKLHNANMIYVDEVDAWWKYAWTSIAGKSTKEFPTEDGWRQGWLTMLTTLRAEAHKAGLRVWVNFGADYDAKEPWQASILDTVDAVNIEFYTGREGVGAQPTTAEDGWLSQNNFLRAAESKGVAVHVHCSSLAQRVVDYAYRSWLLFREPNALGSFSASLDYGGEFRMPSAAITEAVSKLGRPTQPAVFDTATNLYRRKHANGEVVVNPTRTAFGGVNALSGAVRLS